MRPAEACLNQITSFFLEAERQTRITQVALTHLAFFGLMFSMPFYFFGLWCNFIEKLITCVTVIAERSPQRLTLPDQEAALVQLQALRANPTWEAYRNLPLPQKHLVAARHTYPIQWGWHFSSRESLKEVFEREFVDKPNLADAVQGIREAIQIQEKLIFAIRLKETLLLGQDLDGPANQDPETYEQALYFIAREHGCLNRQDPIAFGTNVLRNNPLDPKTVEGIHSMMRSLQAAYQPNYLPVMNPVPQGG